MALNKTYTMIVLITICIISTLYIKRKEEPNKEKEAESFSTQSTQLFTDIKEGKHNNYWDQLGYSLPGTQDAVDCYNLNESDCLKNFNCGLAIKDGNKQCVPGDVHGPLFSSQTDWWQYTNYYDKFIFDDKSTSTTRPWSTFYPDYEAWFPSPQSRATL